jgi:NitT/TauT family transport system substrate-binding protein
MSRALLIGIAASLALSACGGSSEDNTSQASGGVEKPTINVGSLVVPDQAPLQIAIARGFFKEEGLKVNYSPITASPTIVPALQKGTMDFSLFSYMTAFSLADKAPNFLKFVADSYQAAPNTFAIMTAKDSPIKSVSDLKGKSVAIPAPNTLGDLSVTAALKTAGVDPKADNVKYVSMPIPAMPKALATHQVDAIWTAEPFITSMQKTDGAHLLVDTMTGPMKDFPIGGWVATEDFVKKNPKTVAAFQRAIAKAQKIAASDRKAVEQIIPKYTSIKADVVSIIALGSYPTTLNASRMQRVADVLQQFGFITKKGDAKALIYEGAGA